MTEDQVLHLLANQRYPHWNRTSKAAQHIKSHAYGEMYGKAQTHLSWLFTNEMYYMYKAIDTYKWYKQVSFAARYSNGLHMLG